MTKHTRSLKLFFVIFLLCDLIYSFSQHFHRTLEGDMINIVGPDQIYSHVLEDPLGLDVLLHNKNYAAPNRFFAHWSMYKFFRSIPFALQLIIPPIDSIYAACAIAKTIIQFFIIFLISSFITGKKNFFSKESILAAVLITPLFQTKGFHNITIIDYSISYTFFYALPLGLLLLYFLPFYKIYYFEQKKSLTIIQRILLFILAFIITLNGPLPPAIVSIICPMILIYLFYTNFKKNKGIPIFKKVQLSIDELPKDLFFFFFLIFVLSLYSLFIGRNNTENAVSISLMERYAKLFKGIYYLLTTDIGYILLLLMIGLNLFYIKINLLIKGKKIFTLAKWIGFFAIIYILLMPLGGYREYRPYIIRYDTVMPVTLSLIFLFGISAFFILNNIQSGHKKFYISGILIFLTIFTVADKPDYNCNECERNALAIISNSTEDTIEVPSDCTVMAWVIHHHPEYSALQADLFYYWRISKKKVLYYQK